MPKRAYKTFNIAKLYNDFKNKFPVKPAWPKSLTAVTQSEVDHAFSVKCSQQTKDQEKIYKECIRVNWLIHDKSGVRKNGRPQVIPTIDELNEQIMKLTMLRDALIEQEADE